MRILVWLTLTFGKMLNTFSFGYLQIYQNKKPLQRPAEIIVKTGIYILLEFMKIYAYDFCCWILLF